MITPERALELASKIEYWDGVPRIAKPLFINDVIDLDAILRHYAEIMQAEPVARIGENGWGKQLHWAISPDDAPLRGQLIIKPKPLP